MLNDAEHGVDDSFDLDTTVEQASCVIREAARGFEPEILIGLGSGLADLARDISNVCRLGFDQIPGFAPPRVLGHPGQLIIGQFASRRVMALQGRLHLYEGHPWWRVTLLIRVAAALGVRAVLLTNMSGSVNPTIAPGSLVLLEDHLNLFGSNPLVGLPPAPGQPMFPDMSEAYSSRLRAIFSQAAQALSIPLIKGVYAAVSGPNYETPAEVRALARLGADVVGMSTVGEVIVARSLGLDVAGLSFVSNYGAGVVAGTIDHGEGLRLAAAATEQVRQLLVHVLPQF